MERKIASIAKAIRVIAKICRIFIIIGFVFMLALTAFMFALPEGVVQFGVDAIIDYKLSPEIFGQLDGATSSSQINVVFDASDIAPYMVAVLIEMIFAFFILLLVGKIAGKMSDKNAPFSGKAEGCIIALGIVLIVDSIVPKVYTMIVTFFMSVKYGLGARVSFDMNLDLKLVLYILGYILLYMLYKYGALLEKEKAALAEEVSPCAFQSSCQNHSDENTSSVSGEMPSENTSQALTPESSFDLSGQSDSNENNTENLS